MLQCPLCATRYADGTTACPLDHSQLWPVPPPGEYGPRWTPPGRALSISSRGSAGFATAEPPSSGERAAAPEAALDPLLGQTLGGKLRVLRRIGQGGMGTVYIAEHVGLGKQVAVKVLSPQYVQHGPPQPGQDFDLVRRLHTEARHTAAIKNEHIVEIFDIGTTEEGRPYVEMELLIGESLAQRLARCSALSEADTLRVGRQLASALAAAHHSGIVHRDIKPENIFLCTPEAYGKDPGDGDFVKVLDFGISKAVSALGPDAPRGAAAEAESRLTRTGAILGTPLYMSPEQVRGEALDHRVDIYAVGVVLYECLTGSVPHGACNYLAVVAKILTEVPETPSQRSPERAISPELEQIVLRAMAADRQERYPTMETLHEDLRRYAAGQELLPLLVRSPASAPPPAPPPLGMGEGGGALGHLWRPILVGMGLVLGLGGGVAAVLRPRGPWAGAAAPRPEPRPGLRPAGPADAQASIAKAPGAPRLTAGGSPGAPGLTAGGSLAAPRPGLPGPAEPLVPPHPAAAQASEEGAHRPPHRGLRPHPPPAASPKQPRAPGPSDEPLLEEQAPNPFMTPSPPAPSGGTARPDKLTTPRLDPAADDTAADPR